MLLFLLLTASFCCWVLAALMYALHCQRRASFRVHTQTPLRGLLQL